MSDAPVDKEALFELVDEDPEFLKRLIKTFLDDCSVYMEGIREAIEAEEADSLTREAHGLKGAVSNLQAEPAQEAARRLEEIGRSDTLEKAPDALQNLEEEIQRLRSALKAYTDEL